MIQIAGCPCPPHPISPAGVPAILPKALPPNPSRTTRTMSSKKPAKKTAAKPATEQAYSPSKEFSSKARIKSMDQYKEMYKESIDSPSKFWAREASELTWQKKWTKVLDWKIPFAEWFVGGKLNVCENCVDRHADGPRKNKAAIIFEGEPGDRRVITYGELKRDV